MNSTDLYSMFIQILKDQVYQPGHSVNSMAVIDSFPDLKNNSFGKTYTDYLNSRFWARDWEASGADPTAIYANFPVLFIEPRPISILKPDAESQIYSWYLLLVDKIDCSSCPPDMLRSGDLVQEYTYDMLRAVIKEFSTYGLYNINLGEGAFNAWLSSGRLAYYEEETLLTGSAVGPLEQIYSLFEQDSLTFDRWGNMPDIRGTFTSIDLVYCQENPVQYNYKAADLITKARVQTCC